VIRVVFATQNTGKLREFAILATPLVGYEFVSLKDLGIALDVVEDGETFAQNAEKKALAVARVTGLPALADDSGLEVDALGGAPGVKSARFAGDHATDAENNRRLIDSLLDAQDAVRTARFRCDLCFFDGSRGLTLHTQGACEGTIVDSPSGSHGFGYDPHFWLPAYGCTMAQLEAAQKSAISHRGRAFVAMVNALTELRTS
jgi:XTP/dITP diphosphohydrolase